MGALAASERPGGAEVAEEQRGLLDIGQDSLVNSLLVGGALRRELLLLRDVSVVITDVVKEENVRQGQSRPA